MDVLIHILISLIRIMIQHTSYIHDTNINMNNIDIDIPCNIYI